MQNQTTPQLVKITTDTNGNRTVSARELYDFLEVQTKFTMWCERMLEYGFEEGTDYLIHKNGIQVPHQGGYRTQVVIDYQLSIDTAKEISMLQRTYKGKQARKYFIAAEKALHAALSAQPVASSPAPVNIGRQFKELVSTMSINNTKYYRLRDLQYKIMGLTQNSGLPKTLKGMLTIPNQSHVIMIGSHPNAQTMWVDQTALFLYLQASNSPISYDLMDALAVTAKPKELYHQPTFGF